MWACMNFRAMDLFARTNWIIFFTTSVIFEEKNCNISVYKTIGTGNVFFKILQGCNLSCIVDLFAVFLSLRQLTHASLGRHLYQFEASLFTDILISVTG